MARSPFPILTYADVVGNPIANGFLLLNLSEDALSPTGEVCSGLTIRVPLDDTGTITGSPTFWPNADLTPDDTYYALRAYTAQGQLVLGPLSVIIGGGGPFTITSFTGGSSVELGDPIVNPVFAATYSGTPGSAAIANTEGIDSPLNLISPFTSGTVEGTFVHTAAETTTFTLTAIGASTQTATQAITWSAAIFGGVGAAGATSSVTAAGTTAVLSTGDVLPRIQLGAETVGQSFGPYSPSGQVIYLLLLGGSHSFIDAGTGFPFAMNAPITVTFVNEFGATVTLFLYASTNPLFGTFTPKATS